MGPEARDLPSFVKSRCRISRRIFRFCNLEDCDNLKMLLVLLVNLSISPSSILLCMGIGSSLLARPVLDRCWSFCKHPEVTGLRVHVLHNNFIARHLLLSVDETPKLVSRNHARPFLSDMTRSPLSARHIPWNFDKTPWENQGGLRSELERGGLT